MNGSLGSRGSQVGYDLNDPQDRDDRRKHLELVQAIVARLAGASAAAKGWSITVAGAAFGVAVVRASWFVFLLGVGALLVFGVMDGMYLHNERKFRDLYAAIVKNSVEPLSMDRKQNGVRNAAESHRSWSVAGFYVPLAVGGLILMAISIGRDSEKGERPPHSPTPSSTNTTGPAPQRQTTTEVRPPPPTPPAPIVTSPTPTLPESANPTASNSQPR